MIIAGFLGMGKTTFDKNHKNAIDLHIMPYKYSNLNEISMFITKGFPLGIFLPVNMELSKLLWIITVDFFDRDIAIGRKYYLILNAGVI